MIDRLTGAAAITYMIGNPVSQTVLPGQFNRWFEKQNINAMMVPVDLGKDALPEFCVSLRKTKNCLGMVVTAPHKQAILSLVDEVSPSASLVGAVNIVKRLPGGRLFGDNIDGVGFLIALGKNGMDPKGKKALIFGCGGAGSSIAAALVNVEISVLDIIDHDEARAISLAGKFEQIVQVVGTDTSLTDYEIIINATAVGLDGKSMVSSLRGVLPGTLVADIVTSTSLTPLLLHARNLGCRIQVGSDMAKAQFSIARKCFGFDSLEAA